MSFPPFAGEQFLSHYPPNYEKEWAAIIQNGGILAILLLGVIPSLLKSYYNRPTPVAAADTSEEDLNDNLTEVSRSKGRNGEVRVVSKIVVKRIRNTTKNRASNDQDKDENSLKHKEKDCIGKKKQQKKSKTPKQVKSTENDKIQESYDEGEKTKETVKEVPGIVLSLINVLFLITLFLLCAFSPNNAATARQVFVAPLLKLEECAAIIQMAENAALRNAQNATDQLSLHDEENIGDEAEDEKIEALKKILEWPPGWKKDRHFSYPTTDLNVVVDFEKEDKAAIKNILDARLSPLLERVYGVSRDGVRANDMFVVRYDGDGQQSLSLHTDSSHISFNVLLNDEFEGGGTRFHNRMDGTYEDAKPRPGQVLINNAMVSHEGLATTKGTRYIFVGFMNVDQIDPWTRASKKVSYFSTYLSFPWLTVTLKEALMVRQKTTEDDGTNRNLHPILSKNYYVNGILTELVMRFGRFGDMFSPHGIVSLVSDEHAEEYLETLDSFHDFNKENTLKSRWYSGQQIYVHIDGSFRKYWKERARSQEKFTDEL